MRVLMLVSFLIVLSEGLWAQEDSSDYSLQATLSLHDTVIIPSAHDWSDWISPQFLTFLTLESWQEYKADTLARRHIERHIERRSASLVLDSLKPGFHWTSSCVGVDTVWATRPPTFEGWMSWLEQRKASED